jgi:hypothetical protein
VAVDAQGFPSLHQSGLDHGSDFLNLSLRVDLNGIDSVVKRDGEHQANWNQALRKL